MNLLSDALKEAIKDCVGEEFMLKNPSNINWYKLIKKSDENPQDLTPLEAFALSSKLTFILDMQGETSCFGKDLAEHMIYDAITKIEYLLSYKFEEK